MKNNIIALIVAFLIISGSLFYTTNKQSQNNKENREEEITNENNMDYQITLKTNKGDITFETFADKAPNTVDNFVELAEDGFYNGLIFHRVIEGFMIQGGCPEGTGRGGPGYTFDDEIDSSLDIYQGGYDKGTVAMANSGPNTNGSQFFIMVEDYPLPPNYTIFGKVVEGQDVADEISKVDANRNDKPNEDIVMEKVIVEEF
ncbi:MAG: peptidylprolyl isomerase [Patescibacteria group bacterium]